MRPAESDPARGPRDTLVIRPRQLRVMGLVLAPVVVVAFALVSIAFSFMDWPGWRPEIDTVWMNGLGVLIGAALVRFASICAKAGPTGLFVRNIVASRTYEWPEVVGLAYSSRAGDSWARLDLADGTTASVMAIQSADGARADEAAGRLRILIDEQLPNGGDS